MKHMTGNQNGGYHICDTCNNVIITGHGSTQKEKCCGGKGPNCKCR